MKGLLPEYPTVLSILSKRPRPGTELLLGEGLVTNPRTERSNNERGKQ